LRKKIEGKLSVEELRQFMALSKQLAPFRLDPTLQVTQEDSLTRLVRENIDQRHNDLNKNGLKIPEDLPQQVDDILNDIFKTAA
jgi:hypothetical protein